jgi:hypothetical protein
MTDFLRYNTHQILVQQIYIKNYSKQRLIRSDKSVLNPDCHFFASAVYLIIAN